MQRDANYAAGSAGNAGRADRQQASHTGKAGIKQAAYATYTHTRGQTQTKRTLLRQEGCCKDSGAIKAMAVPVRLEDGAYDVAPRNRKAS